MPNFKVKSVSQVIQLHDFTLLTQKGTSKMFKALFNVHHKNVSPSSHSYIILTSTLQSSKQLLYTFPHQNSLCTQYLPHHLNQNSHHSNYTTATVISRT